MKLFTLTFLCVIHDSPLILFSLYTSILHSIMFQTPASSEGYEAY